MRIPLVWSLAAAALLTACGSDDDDSGGRVGAISLFDPAAVNPSLCGGAAIPFPNNVLFSGTADGTLNIPNAAGTSFVTAANLTDGFSTAASIFTDVLGAVDYRTAPGAILILEANVGSAPRFLVAGTDFTVQPSIALAQVSGTGPAAGACASTGLPAKFLPISQQRSRLLIEPLKPLKPSTTYIVAVTRDLKSAGGGQTLPNEFFRIVNSDTKLCDLTGAEAGAELDCTDPAAPAEAAARLGEPALGSMSAPPTTANQKLATLETLRRSLVRPTLTALKGAHEALRGEPLDDDDLVIAWSFTTQSIDLTLSRLDTSTSEFFVANTTISTGDLGLGLADTADIYAGTLETPYYLANSGGSASSTAPLSTYWTSTSTDLATSPPALGGAVTCAMLAKSASTTLCNPDPELASTEALPVIVAVPRVGTKPEAGWPVAVFQHGITRNRTDALALAPTLATAGFVTVSIDQPLHGITDNSSSLATNPFYRNQIFSNPAFGGTYDALITGERTFDLDVVDNATGAPGPGGGIDSSGTHFVNLASLITSRDNLRQAEADILHLARSLGALDLDGSSASLAADDIDESRIYFVGQSLGAIVGTVALGVDAGADSAADGSDELFDAASLHVPGGALGKLLDASASFGPRIAAGLGALGVFEGTDTYETFVRFAQHLVDPGDPVNYAAAANANHPLHVVQVIGDAVVPNSAFSTCPARRDLPAGIGATATSVDAPGTAAAAQAASAALLALCPPLVIPADPPLAAITYQDETVITGYLSGTDPLVDILGITERVEMGNAPFTAQASAGADTLVVFGPDTAEHGTLLSPDSSAVSGADATFAPATCAMQKQTATFLASNGALLPIGGSCP